nr:MAG TPA: tail protein [Caudoviricetes sp.]
MAYPILYKANETNFEHLGVSVLSDASKCHVSREKNGIYILEFDYPVNGKDVDKIKEGMYIKSDAGYRTKNQRFVVSKITKTQNEFKIYCQHISQVKTTMNAIRPDITLTSVSAMGALTAWRDNLLDSREEFFVQSDIGTLNSTTWKVENIENARDALGGKAGSILDVWGGEYEFDNLNITLHKSMGIDNPTIIAYGKNLLDLEQEQSILETYTSVFPFKKYTDDNNREQLITLPEILLDSTHLNKFTHRRILKVDFSSDENIKAVEQLRSKAKSYIKNNNVGVPKTNLKINYQDLSKVEGVFDNPALEQIDLCDRLKVYYSELGILNENAKVVKVIWDVILEENHEIEVGDGRSSFTDSTSAKIETLQAQNDSVIARINALVAEQDAAFDRFFKEKSKIIEDKVKEGVEKNILSAEEKERLFNDQFEKKLAPLREEVNNIVNDFTKGLPERIKENLKGIDIDSAKIDELKTKIDEVSEKAETTLKMVGADGIERFNKNRLDGGTERDIPLGTPFIEISHNGDGFEVGKPYVISWEATCRTHDNYNVKFVFNRLIEFPIKVIMQPTNTLYPTAEKTFTEQEGTIFSVYNGGYNVSFDSKWYKIQNTYKNIIEATTINVEVQYKEYAEGIETADYQGEWNNEPKFIFDGGGN